ncbi:MAG: DUF1232 domain-containing protein [Burkholderiales bacterium]|nr:DUF1232 domain-containing protein [Burkholderiales bacterium]
MWRKLIRWADELKGDGLTLWFCCRHRDMPWLPRILALIVVGYFLSPIDLIPDFIPVLGYLDELLLLPLGIYLILKLVPAPVLAESRAKAAAWIAGHHATPKSIVAAAVIMLLWMLFFAALWNYYGDSVMEFIGAN